MFDKILVPVDGSKLSLNAVRVAVEIARERQARLVLLNVQMPYQPPAFAEVPMALPMSEKEYDEAVRRASQKLLSDATRLPHAAGLQYQTVTRIALSPWKAIITVARSRGIDLIVMASHGRRGLAGMLLGSETQKVLTHCTVPVLVTR